MKYCVVTYDNQIYWLNETQCELAASALLKGTAFMELPGKKMIASKSVKYCGSEKGMPYIENKEFVPAEQKSINPDQLGFSQLYLKGDPSRLGRGQSPESIKKLQMAAKKVWYEHVKRRPDMDKAYGRNARYSQWEQVIIGTSLEELMANFEKEYDAKALVLAKK